MAYRIIFSEDKEVIEVERKAGMGLLDHRTYSYPASVAPDFG